VKLTLRAVSKEIGLRTLWVVLGLEVLIFFLPTSGKIEGVSVEYWHGVRLRFLSGNYWARALLCGIGVAILLTVVTAFARYLARFADPPSDDSREGGPDKSSSA
jgi:hypothetical protein